MEDLPLILPTIADGEDKSSILGNRIRKNYRHLRKWAKRSGTDCFRIYGRDIKEFPIAIDFYAGRFCVQYFSSTHQDDGPPAHLKQETEKVLCAIFAITPNEIYWRTRSKHKETRQYEKQDDAKEFFEVREYGLKFKVNLCDYLDTGLFLDHRETRKLVASASAGKRVLNLFAYTCSFSVHAAAAGAIFTKSVDMSNTYTEWGRDNFVLNSLSLRHNDIVRADCLKFLDEEVDSKIQYDIIIIDPPTMSRSKKMDQLFDVNVDYISLISSALQLLAKDGIIFFSTNSRKFIFDMAYFESSSIIDITHKTIPVDFRDSKIHRCWIISHLVK
ncbi:MAG: class I SAM-dependent methyltransferase [Chlamydiales bacterium]|nr:class I SAM-dependent methyltransferase [Chlamydiales bacterium]